MEKFIEFGPLIPNCIYKHVALFINLRNHLQNFLRIISTRQAIVFMRHHLHPTFQLQYLTMTLAHALWATLQKWFNNQQTIFLPQACYDWTHFKVQDYPTITKCNIDMYKIASYLILCGEPIDDIIDDRENSIYISCCQYCIA